MKKRILAMTAAAALLLVAGCATQGPVSGTATAAADAGTYEKLGLSPAQVQPWEDGMRTTGVAGTYEWWYFDFIMDDGSTLVIVYYTKDFTQPGTGLKPFVTFQYDRPGEAQVWRAITVSADQFSASPAGCDVTVGKSTLRGDLTDYTLHVEGSGLLADVTLHRTAPSWRPGTGYMMFHKPAEHYFAWLPSVPQGTFQGTVSVDGVQRSITGAAYHDHNWGDVSMLDLIHDWYWGRAQVGPYTVIASYITARAEYGSTPVPLFMLARDGKILAEDASKVTFSLHDVYTDAYTGKPVANLLVYDYDDGTSRYRVTFHREKDINRTRFVDLLDPLKAFLARLSGFDGAYLRFTGPAQVENLSPGSAAPPEVERSAVWELMYFGHAPR
jgi:hypothetical protein